MKQLLAVGAATAALVGGVVAGSTVADITPPESVTFVGPGTAELQPGQYVGPCSIVTPPEPDPCEAAQLVLRHSFWGEMVNAAYFKKWKQGSPGDYGRLLALMAAPICSTPAHPQPQTMRTPQGAALANVIEAYACALGAEPIAMPAANPKPTGTDRTPPSAPGPLQVDG